MKDIAFELAVFDEAQHIKNQGTLSHKAAREINAKSKLGLTGTPIENTIIDMKALMDLVIPGYLGSDKAFDKRYVVPIEKNADQYRRKELQRIIAPFTLRRMKRTVLDDLPEKIEDVRACRLSSEQIALYREAIAANGKGFLQSLQLTNKKVPYIHIFALLTLLKQICNHPASLKNNSVTEYERHESGKWDLFVELINEGVESGQKIVVYSQFLNMIEIIGRHLQKLGVDYTTLTGSTRNRGKCIDRFNNDQACKVFVSSLKAGGSGIDLVGGSVVIHYDRWWNAAKEDQATERVHRTGQTRGVQVFKLMTEGTLEEKISSIIDKKRTLMDEVVKEDDLGLLKSFSRDDLIEMLAAPDEN